MSNTSAPLVRAYVGAVVGAGIIVVTHSLLTLSSAPVNRHWFILAGLTLLSGSFTVRMPGIPARLSVSETFVFAAVLLFGPAAATLIVVLDTLVISFWSRKSSRRAQRVPFNVAAPAVGIWVASHLFFALAGIPPLAIESQRVIPLVLPLFVMALAYFLLNSALVAGIVAIESDTSGLVIWRQNFSWLSLNYLGGASVAALLIPYLQGPESEFVKVIGIILPLLLISYLTFKTALGRVEDSNLHLVKLNKLYLSTIETLAMAIDAKDQITHGHIRRVQTHAVQLAKAMGITETAQIQAIEAAALLHDMGKLAIPEYILNKPGPLTPAEFEKMKLHASVGADILSAIDFPYPVVPIVRHHHENWDGTGYPAGIKGGEIPIGARILSVVDCFDALTSDRPYRPKLSDADALRIVTERRGKMYDPLVVDTFIQIQPDLKRLRDALPSTPAPSDTRDQLAIEAADSSRGERLDEITASRAETMVLMEFSRELASAQSPIQIGMVALQHVKRLIPTSLAVLFVRDESADGLIALAAVGEHAEMAKDLSMRVGQQLTGWVAANKQTIRNSNAMLDLGEATRTMTPRPVAALSTAVVGDEVIGVLTVYSTRPNAFTEDHERVVEAIAHQLARPLALAVFPDRRPGKTVGQERGRILRSVKGGDRDFGSAK